MDTELFVQGVDSIFYFFYVKHRCKYKCTDYWFEKATAHFSLSFHTSLQLTYLVRNVLYCDY